MKRKVFYHRLAFDGIRKNRQLYIPYMLTSVCMVMMFYILRYLSDSNECISSLKGSASLMAMLSIGSFVVLIFSVIFLFYTNSFLTRRRRKEFGLYNALGIDKRSIVRIITWESVISSSISIIVGIALGILFSKLAELAFIKLLNGDIEFGFSVKSREAIITAAAYSAVFFLIWFFTSIRVGKSTAVSLMNGEKEGERPLKVNWFFGILGLLVLAGAYYIAITIKSPIETIIYFLIAVIMVIIATYMIMISGSVMICRILQNKKSYYYKPKHFISVSSMAYRMKRNGAGLASICILATMVLVMLSSTTCLFFGTKDIIKSRYPRQVNVSIEFDSVDDMELGNLESIIEVTDNAAIQSGAVISNVRSNCYAQIYGYSLDGIIYVDSSDFAEEEIDYNKVYSFYFISKSEYEHLYCKAVSIDKNEAYLICSKELDLKDKLIFKDIISFDINGKETGKKYFDASRAGSIVSDLTVEAVIVVVNDVEEAVSGFSEMTDSYGDKMLMICSEYGFDTGLDEAGQRNVGQALLNAYDSSYATSLKYTRLLVNTRASSGEDYFASNAGLFFLGIVLSLLFAVATVLIIYYKQISEGIEDERRFGIMQKVGMTKQEIRRTIDVQMLSVFFLPLLFAGLHLTFAFPMIYKLLMMFGFTDIRLFIHVTLLSFTAFAVFYAIVYKVTSNVYYNIVSGKSVSDR